MNLTRRTLFASALAPVIARADSFKNLLKAEYVYTTCVSQSCLHACNQACLRAWVKSFGKDRLYNKFYKRSLLHRDYDSIDCIVVSSCNPVKYIRAKLVHENNLKLYYTLRLIDTSYEDPYGVYDVYLPKDIYIKYLSVEKTGKPDSIFV